MCGRRRRFPRRAFRRTLSWRSCHACPAGRCAASSVCPKSGSPSAPTPTPARCRCRPCPASSTMITACVSTICPEKVLPWSTPTSLSCAAAISISVSRNAAPAFSFASAGKFPILSSSVGILFPKEKPSNFLNGPRLTNSITLSAILPLRSGLRCLL